MRREPGDAAGWTLRYGRHAVGAVGWALCDGRCAIISLADRFAVLSIGSCAIFSLMARQENQKAPLDSRPRRLEPLNKQNIKPEFSGPEFGTTLTWPNTHYHPKPRT